MKKRVCIVMVCSLSTLCAGDSCIYPLDALEKTVLVLTNDAHDIYSGLVTFTSECTRVSRASGCACSATPITEAGALSGSGPYCLAQDITGDIDAEAFAATIDLNGHVVSGNVILGPQSSIKGGTITGRLTLGSYSRAENIRAGELFGVTASQVFVDNLTLASDALLSGFNQISFDHLHCMGDVTFEDNKDVVIRNAQVYGNLIASDSSLENFALYDSSVTGTCLLTCDEGLSHLGLWHNSLLDIDFILEAGGLPAPVITMYGCSMRNASFQYGGSIEALRSAVLIDQCSGDSLLFVTMNNIRLQNSIFITGSSLAPIFFLDCEQLTIDHVDAFQNKLTFSSAYWIGGGKNILLKQCSGSTKGSFSPAYYCSNDTLKNCNLYECTAKRSYQGFSFPSSQVTGTVIRCVADSCAIGFSAAQPSGMVFIGNVSVGNTGNDYSPSGALFNETSDPLTASSWRNIAS